MLDASVCVRHSCHVCYRMLYHPAYNVYMAVLVLLWSHSGQAAEMAQRFCSMEFCYNHVVTVTSPFSSIICCLTPQRDPPLLTHV